MQHFGNRQSVVFKSTIFYLNSNFDRSGCGYQHKIFIFCLFCNFMLFYFNATKRETQETYLWMMFSIPKFACNKQLIPSNTTSFNTSSYLTAECYSVGPIEQWKQKTIRFQDVPSFGSFFVYTIYIFFQGQKLA